MTESQMQQAAEVAAKKLVEADVPAISHLSLFRLVRDTIASHFAPLCDSAETAYLPSDIIKAGQKATLSAAESQVIRKTVWIVDDGDGNYFLYSFLIPEDEKYIAVPLISRDGGKTWQLDDTAKDAEIRGTCRRCGQPITARHEMVTHGDSGHSFHQACDLMHLNEAKQGAIDNLRAKLAAKDAEIARLAELNEQWLEARDAFKAERDATRNAAGFCDKHKPDGGSRNCLVCACEKLSMALSQIDYIVGEPNEQCVSLFDVDYNEDRVVNSVSKEIARLRAIVDKLPRTADGVPIVPGMPLWFTFRGKVVSGNASRASEGRVSCKYDEEINLTDDEEHPVMTDESDPSLSVVFSTREAALDAAKEAK